MSGCIARCLYNTMNLISLLLVLGGCEVKLYPISSLNFLLKSVRHYMKTCPTRRYVLWRPKNDASPSTLHPLIEVVWARVILYDPDGTRIYLSFKLEFLVLIMKLNRKLLL